MWLYKSLYRLLDPTVCPSHYSHVCNLVNFSLMAIDRSHFCHVHICDTYGWPFGTALCPRYLRLAQMASYLNTKLKTQNCHFTLLSYYVHDTYDYLRHKWSLVEVLQSLPSVRLFVCPSVRLSDCPSVRLSFCSSVCYQDSYLKGLEIIMRIVS